MKIYVAFHNKATLSWICTYAVLFGPQPMPLFWGATSVPRVQAGITAMTAKLLPTVVRMRTTVLNSSLKPTIQFLVQVKKVTSEVVRQKEYAKDFSSLWQFSEWNLWSANKLPCLLFLWKSLKRGKTTRYWYIAQLGLRLTKLKACSQECPQLILARSWYDQVNC